MPFCIVMPTSGGERKEGEGEEPWGGGGGERCEWDMVMDDDEITLHIFLHEGILGAQGWHN